jgi:CDP-glycerol glycerophosphotransferase
MKRFLMIKAPRLTVALYKLYVFTLGLLYKFFRVFSVDKQKVYVESNGGLALTENESLVIEELMQRCPELKIYNALSSQCDQAEGKFNIIRKGTLEWIYNYATSSIWIVANFLPPWISKRNEQTCVQLWHGALPIKKVSKYGSEDSVPYISLDLRIRSANNTDFYVAGSKWRANDYKNNFLFQGEILESGYPRLDIASRKLTDEELVSIKSKYRLPNKKLFIYAPTFRKEHNTTYYDLDFGKIKSVLEKRFGGEWLGLVRLHPLDRKLNRSLFKGDICDVTDEACIYGLFPIIDVLITDYSSIGLEYYLCQKKPVFLYASDYGEYYKQRGFSDIMLSIAYCTSNRELCQQITNFDIDKHVENVKMFSDLYGLILNNNAARLIVDRIISLKFNHNITIA